MNFNMKNRSIALTSALLISAASAFAADEQESVVQEQKTLLEKLDSLQESVLGLKFNGTAKAGALTSMATSDQFSDDSPTQENQAYTDVNFMLTARPSSESMITLQLRLHKDWQSAFDENNNPVLGHWFSYDGSILDKHLNFNLGYMRLGFTPLTVYSAQPLLLQEPEVFAQKRVEALAQRNLDTTSRRLLQGLNVDYHSGKLGVIDDIHAQLAGARLRNIAKKTDQVFFDFDYSDRYFYGGRLGVSAFGANLGVNYTDAFDRKLSRRAHRITSDTVYYEDNSVLSIEAGFDSKKMLSDLPVTFGLNGEFAMTNWDVDRDYTVKSTKTVYSVTEMTYVNRDNNTDKTVVVKPTTKSDMVDTTEHYGDDDGTGFYVTPFVKLDMAGIDATVKGTYLQTEENFWSEMASAPSYRGSSVVLNANAVYSEDIYSEAISKFGMSSLENLYMAVYNSNPMNVTNLMTTGAGNVLTDESEAGQGYLYSRVANNYKNAHFYRNGYDASTVKRLEYLNQSTEASFLDPSVNMALPFGLATPNRKGFTLSLDLKWNDAVFVNGYFGQVKSPMEVVDMLTGATSSYDNTYTEYAAGLGVDIGRLVNLDRKILLQGSYDHAEEDNSFKRSSDRIMAGASIDVYGPVSFLGGVQTATREFGTGFFVNEMVSIMKAEEMMVLVGPRVRIAPNSYLSLQYGMLTDKLTYRTPGLDAASLPIMLEKDISIDKNIIIGDVTVNF